jgi:hypothetical protein
LAYVYPGLNGAGQIFLPEVRLVLDAETFAERERIARPQRKGEDPHHHALISLRGVSCDGQSVIAIVIAIHVRDLQDSFEDRCLERHYRESKT